MKTLRNTFLILGAALVIGLCGCSAAKSTLAKVYTTMPGGVIGTNVVMMAAVTNELTGQIVTATTNFVPVYAPDTVAPSAVAAGAVNLVSALPIPWAGTVGFALTSLLSLGAAWRNRRLAVGVVQSVDAARQWIRQTPEGKAVDAQLLHVLEQHQEAAGIFYAVSGLVDQYTGKTTSTT